MLFSVLESCDFYLYNGVVHLWSVCGEVGSPPKRLPHAGAGLTSLPRINCIVSRTQTLSSHSFTFSWSWNETITSTVRLVCSSKVLRAGHGDHTRPTSSSRVTVRVKGKLQDGSVVEEDESLSFFAGEGEVVQGVWCGVCADIKEQLKNQKLITWTLCIHHCASLTSSALSHSSPALDLVVSLMAEGELCLIEAAARFAYGDHGQ